MYALVDCNNFYVSIQRVFQPNLNGKPVVALSNNDGCVISRSNEAKEIGIKMGDVLFQIEEIIKMYQVNIFSSNYPLIADMSNRVMDTLATFTPDIEVYSVDEAFLYFNGFEKHFDFQKIGEEIRRTILKNLGIPVSIGFGPTKSLAKAANKFAKKYPKLGNHVCVLDSDEKIKKALKKTEINDVWGIGRRITKRLKEIEINNAFEYVNLNENYIRAEFGVNGTRLQSDLKGISAIGPELTKPKQTISNTRSFPNDVTELDKLKERVATFTITGAASLRAQNSNANLVCVFLQTNRHRQNQAQYNPSIIFPTDIATSSSLELTNTAIQALERIYKPGFRYKKAGVILMGITPANCAQANLFKDPNPKHLALMTAMDEINSKIGRDTVCLAVQDFSKNKKWKMRQEYLSPCYTTRIKDIPKLKCF